MSHPHPRLRVPGPDLAQRTTGNCSLVGPHTESHEIAQQVVICAAVAPPGVVFLPLQLLLSIATTAGEKHTYVCKWRGSPGLPVQ